MKKDDVKTVIVVISVCLICISIGILLTMKSNFEKLTPVNEYSVFFSKVNYINNYLNYIYNGDSKGLYDLLDKRYIEENNITYDNVLDNVEIYSGSCYVNFTSMDYVNVGDNSAIYYVRGKIYEIGFEKEELVDDNFSIIITNDFDNLSFSLYPVSDDYKEVINSIKRISIDRNGHNEIKATNIISKEQVCVNYLSDFMNNLFSDVSSSYNLLSDDMKKIYTSSNNFQEYISNNINLISSTADKCRLDELDDKRRYTVIDTNGNTYIFTEEYIMNYEVDFYLNDSLTRGTVE